MLCGRGGRLGGVRGRGGRGGPAPIRGRRRDHPLWPAQHAAAAQTGQRLVNDHPCALLDTSRLHQTPAALFNQTSLIHLRTLCAQRSSRLLSVSWTTSLMRTPFRRRAAHSLRRRQRSRASRRAASPASARTPTAVPRCRYPLDNTEIWLLHGRLSVWQREWGAQELMPDFGLVSNAQENLVSLRLGRWASRQAPARSARRSRSFRSLSSAHCPIIAHTHTLVKLIYW